MPTVIQPANGFVVPAPNRSAVVPAVSGFVVPAEYAGDVEGDPQTSAVIVGELGG